MKISIWCLAGWLCCAGQALAADGDFDVQFDRCKEFVGIGAVPWENARARVPQRFDVLRSGDSALLVVRVTQCDAISVAGQPAKPARTAQLGVMLNVPGSGADIDNYLLWFASDSGALQGKLQAAGLDSDIAQQLTLLLPASGTGPLSSAVRAPHVPEFRVQGSASQPSFVSQFIANWYADGRRGEVRMHTEFPAITFGVASSVLTTAAADLTALIGATSLSFPVLDSYNAWPSARMTSRLQ